MTDAGGTAPGMGSSPGPTTLEAATAAARGVARAAAATGAPIVEVEDLHKSYGALHVLKGISLTVERGDVIVLIGPAGRARARSCAASTG